ncbi:MAG: L-ribulose-5-phosphate 4-epimerase [Halanaerobiales bacterium]
MLEKLKKTVYEANLELKRKELIIYTWGNVSGFDDNEQLIVIKPSGVPYEKLNPEKMVVVNLEGKVVEGDLNPSSDTETHLELYRNFDGIGGIVHTHSPWATGWAQARSDIPCYGTTHADYFYKEIPCTRNMTAGEIEKNYELNTGKVIVEEFSNRNHIYTPGVLVAGHGPFTWGEDPEEAVHNSVVLEEIAKIAYRTEQISPENSSISSKLRDKHFYRKHGEEAYYGQN